MAESRYLEQFKKYILFERDVLFVISLYSILNEKNEVKSDDKLKFVMTYDEFKQYLIKLREAAKDSCGIVCSKSKMCIGHETLDLMEKYENFIIDCAKRWMFYNRVEFVKVNKDTDPMFGFVIKPLDKVDGLENLFPKNFSCKLDI